MRDPADLSLVEAAAAIAGGDLSPVELTEACLERVRAVEPLLGAFAKVDAEGARRQAAELDAELVRSGPRGPLHGVPVGVKDIADVRGFPTGAGSRVPDARPAERDAAVVERLRAAGVVVLGKTTTHELAIGVTTASTANPWDPARVPGGSSGGSAAAVAAGECLLALGTDTAGSIRIPASFCGVSGLKARPRGLPMEGILPLAPSMDSAGLMARGPADVALAWHALVGGEPSEPRAGLRVGVPRALPEWVDPAVAAAVSAAVDALTSDGGARVEVELPPFEAWDRPRGRVLVAEALAAHRDAGWYPARVDRYGEEPLAYLRAAERLAPADIAEARDALAALVRALLEALSGIDVLALPSTPGPAPLREGGEPAHVRDARHARELTRLVGPANAAGLAAAAVPCGRTGEGLPIGMQLVAADEALALEAALAYERTADVGLWRPPAPSDRLEASAAGAAGGPPREGAP